jgi:Sulfotransferase domain
VRPAFCKLWVDFYDGDFILHGKRRYREHYEEIRRLAPRENLLEYNISQGWRPLCDFLGDPVPLMEFPRGIEIGVFQRNIARMFGFVEKFYALRLATVFCYAMVGYLALKWAKRCLLKWSFWSI